MSKIYGISLSKLTNEFVIHGSDSEYDYNYISEKRKLIIKILSGLFIELQGKELIIFELNQKSLKDWVTLKNEKKDNPFYTRMPKSDGMDATVYLNGGDVPETLNIRLNAHRGTIYSKLKTIPLVGTEDFKFIKVLGRGSFGKVATNTSTRLSCAADTECSLLVCVCVACCARLF